MRAAVPAGGLAAATEYVSELTRGPRRGSPAPDGDRPRRPAPIREEARGARVVTVVPGPSDRREVASRDRIIAPAPRARARLRPGVLRRLRAERCRRTRYHGGSSRLSMDVEHGERAGATCLDWGRRWSRTAERAWRRARGECTHAGSGADSHGLRSARGWLDAATVTVVSRSRRDQREPSAATDQRADESPTACDAEIRGRRSAADLRPSALELSRAGRSGAYADPARAREAVGVVF